MKYSHIDGLNTLAVCVTGTAFDWIISMKGHP